MAAKMIAEEWRPLPGWGGIYSFNARGMVRRERKNASTWVGRILKERSLPRGYHIVGLEDHSVVLVHRLVALWHFGPCPHNKEVNHKNGIKTDNRPKNLEYVTRRENCLHSYRVLGRKASVTCGESHWWTKLAEHEVRRIKKLHRRGAAIRQIARDFDVSRGAVECIVHGKSWKHVV